MMNLPADSVLQNVSRETLARLKTYQDLLEMWQKKVNLISSATQEKVWERHFKDSLQLLPYLPRKTLSLIDMGSGAGFPGLVLALARPETLKVTLVESDLKKALFLENVSRETKCEVTILRERIESLGEKVKRDIVTARGLAPLPQLLEYTQPLMKRGTICLFLKGKNVHKEIQDSQKSWQFKLEIFPSITDLEGRILKITDLQRIRPHDENHSHC